MHGKERKWKEKFQLAKRPEKGEKPEEKYKKLESKDGKCPYCQSDYVLKTGTFSSETSASAKLIWKCYRGNKEFFCIESQ